MAEKPRPRKASPQPARPRKAAARKPAARKPAATATATASRSERRKTRGRVSRRTAGIAFAVVVGVAAAAGAGVWLLSYDDSATSAPTLGPTTTTATAAPVTTAGSLIATTKVPTLAAYTEPNEASTVVTELTNVTEYGLPRTLLVTEQQPGWLKTLLPIRPNGSTGWIREADVALSSTTLRVEIDLTRKYLEMFDGDTRVLETAVAIGKDETPTPPGIYYITDPVDLQSKPTGTYGAYALGISGFSDVLTSFRGGPGQLAVHGTGNESDIGQRISNGCIRIPNRFIVEMAKARTARHTGDHHRLGVAPGRCVPECCRPTEQPHLRSDAAAQVATGARIDGMERLTCRARATALRNASRTRPRMRR